MGRQTVLALCKFNTYPFKENEYHRVELLNRAPYGPMRFLSARETDSDYSGFTSVIVFQREHEGPLTIETPILEVFVTGDAAYNIHAQLHGQKENRPVVHDLMFNLLARAAEMQPGQWQLLRVAIVALKDDLFVGRLFFGDAATGTVCWDCDCRPSDGVYLSLRTQCPIYVARSVWEEAAAPLRLSKVHMLAVKDDLMAKEQQQQQHEQMQASQHQTQAQGGASGAATAAMKSNSGCKGASAGGGGASSSSPYDFTAIKLDDIEDIKLLKRELAIALQEEDYAAAARLRDHPYMQLYRRIEAFRLLGRASDAEALQRELATMITRNNAGVA
ncbi:hypothetical protein VOLCADRAFT_103159 [Volvox carteri f. nagariensis]|uniref:BFN domain-containing protein n=1 Tax=Volvox carteri f. nagariensis TaxID=3068 RepID=D8TJV9_VOLCA|nr:uncharacterized protein VOLCADRAFT_103159 [Volvox carteri f. nagariensis]EFJ52139.1 hypothetical protein VOLCADRAFT_103159 [Volvox carteri f. nagariensis]|eukprot:XP_002946913.1 hypothetical protein VOLCADRAFT_103159 [Volvox carteri f. nagariensis]